MVIMFQVSAQVQDPSLKLYFDFETDFSGGQVSDRSGHQNHGWRFNPENWIQSTNGVFGGRAAQFTTNSTLGDTSGHVYPVSQYIGVTNLLGISVLSNATISFWAQFDTNRSLTITLLGAGYSPKYTPRPEVVSNSWNIGRQYRAYLAFIVFAAGTEGVEVVRWPVDVIRAGGSNPNLGTLAMHMYGVTIDCSRDEAIAYYDGRAYMTNRVGVPWIRISGYPRAWLCIGANRHVGTPEWGDDLWPNDGYHQGKLDEIRIYDRVLSAQEIMALYRGADTPAAARHVAAVRTEVSTIVLRWLGRKGSRYQVECCGDISAGLWQPDGEPIEGVEEPMQTDRTIDRTSSRFFRVYPLP